MPKRLGNRHHLRSMYTSIDGTSRMNNSKEQARAYEQISPHNLIPGLNALDSLYIRYKEKSRMWDSKNG